MPCALGAGCRRFESVHCFSLTNSKVRSRILSLRSEILNGLKKVGLFDFDSEDLGDGVGHDQVYGDVDVGVAGVDAGFEVF